MKVRYAQYYKSGGKLSAEIPSVTYRVYKFLWFTFKVVDVVVLENPVLARFYRMKGR